MRARVKKETGRGHWLMKTSLVQVPSQGRQHEEVMAPEEAPALDHLQALKRVRCVGGDLW